MLYVYTTEIKLFKKLSSIKEDMAIHTNPILVAD